MALVLRSEGLRTLRGGLHSSSGGGEAGDSGSGGGGGGSSGRVDSGGEGGGVAVVQEFVNHGGVQYKAYVIGDKVRAGQRRTRRVAQSGRRG
jgi:hypothetical protein